MMQKNLSKDMDTLLGQDIDQVLAQESGYNFDELIQDKDMFDEYCNLKERKLFEDYEIEINYMTYSQVKRKRYELYKKKLMF
tara:strand:- start:1707 stop:1952 length:246 start_codon:yes stop_codon:yes gene_type:complete